MSGKAAERLRARAQNITRAAPRGEGAGDQVVAKVRRTVDVTPDQHRELNRLADRAAEERRFSRVSSQDLLQTALAVLLADEELQLRVTAALPAPSRKSR